MQRGFSSCLARLEELCSPLSAAVNGALGHVQTEVLEAAEPGVCVALPPARHYSLSLNTGQLCFRARRALVVEFLSQRGHVGLWG